MENKEQLKRKLELELKIVLTEIEELNNKLLKLNNKTDDSTKESIESINERIKRFKAKEEDITFDLINLEKNNNK